MIWILSCVCVLERLTQLLLGFFRESSLVNLALIGLERGDDGIGVGLIDGNEKGAMARLKGVAELFDEFFIHPPVK